MSDLDKLCERINQKYKLISNRIGSIDIYSDMYETSVIQFCNQYRGHRVLLSGDEDTLKTYLQNILDGKIILNFWEV